jgi:hypothetical protein
VTPIVLLAVFVPSATLVAVIVTTPAAAGGVNVTDLHGALHAKKLPPGFADHVTPAFVVSFVSVAVSDSSCEVVIPPRLGLTLTVMLDPPPDGVVAVALFE